jgi:hypothetical protein
MSLEICLESSRESAPFAPRAFDVKLVISIEANITSLLALVGQPNPRIIVIFDTVFVIDVLVWPFAPMQVPCDMTAIIDLPLAGVVEIDDTITCIGQRPCSDVLCLFVNTTTLTRSSTG